MTSASSATGYAHPGYAASLAEFGTPLPLIRSGGHLLMRPIPGHSRRDATAPYPLLVCEDWRALAADLAAMPGNLVSVVAVSDPLGNYTPGTLRGAFPECVRPYKEHFLVDCAAWPGEAVSRHHRRNTRRALASLEVDEAACPLAWIEDWLALYGVLVKRHAIAGVAAFSRRAFAAQFALPGLRMFRAQLAGAVVGMAMWFVQGMRAYYHLGCANADGYRTGAAFALFQTAIESLIGTGVRTLAIGAGAGEAGDPGDGLTRFKRGWATRTATAYLCGRICDPEAYARLAAGVSPTEFFPAYRAPVEQ